MRIIWSFSDNCFELEFATGDSWQGDLDSAKAAGFKTTGPPGWRWQTSKIEPLLKLRENKPLSGLTISDEALVRFKLLHDAWLAGEPLRQQLLEAKKAQKKHRETVKKGKDAIPLDLPDGKWWIDASDLPPSPPFIHKHKSNVQPVGVCKICHDATFDVFGVLDNQDLCIWCEMQLEKIEKSEIKA